MDNNLPGIDGFEAWRLLRAAPVTCGIPVVALSVNSQPHDEARGLKAGFFRYLTKPLQVPVFMDTLDAAIASRTATERRAG
jgi:CheY-like chemotaxis protein